MVPIRQVIWVMVAMSVSGSVRAATLSFDGPLGALTGPTTEGVFRYDEFGGANLLRRDDGNPSPSIAADEMGPGGILRVVRTATGGLFTFDRADIAQDGLCPPYPSCDIEFEGFRGGVSQGQDVFTASTTDLDFTTHSSVSLHGVLIDELRIAIDGGVPESEILDNLVLSPVPSETITFSGPVGPLTGDTVEGSFTYAEFGGANLLRRDDGNPSPSIAADEMGPGGILRVVRTATGGLFTFDRADIAQDGLCPPYPSCDIEFEGFRGGVSQGQDVFTASTTDLDFTTHASVNLQDALIDELRITIAGGVPESELVDNLVLVPVSGEGLTFDGALGSLTGPTVEGSFSYDEFGGANLLRRDDGKPPPSIAADETGPGGMLRVVRTAADGLFTFERADIAEDGFCPPHPSCDIEFEGFRGGVWQAQDVFVSSDVDLNFSTRVSVNLRDVLIDELRITIDGGIPESEIVDNLVLNAAEPVPTGGFVGTIVAVAVLLLTGAVMLARGEHWSWSRA